MELEEINFGETWEGVRKAISNNLGRQVFLKDLHEGWVHVVISKKQYYDNNEIYHVHFQDKRGEKDLNFSDLRQLFVLRPTRNYELPQAFH